MDKKIRSILDELESFMPEDNKHRLVEVRAENIIASCLNLLEDIRNNFSEDEYAQLKGKLINAIRAEDSKKFTHKIRQLEENTKPKR